MNAVARSISDILNGQNQYVIPVFQRMYEWSEVRWESLWNDLLAIYNEPDYKFTHFIGPMVVIANASPGDVPQFSVIDGQQRLLTLSVLLAALRDRARALSLVDLANAIDTSTTLSFKNTKGKEIFKIHPRSRDRDVLNKIIHSHSDEINQELLLSKAYKYIITKLEELTPTQRDLFKTEAAPLDILEGIYNAITQRFKTVMITLDYGDNPSNIYESLNFKNASLFDSDLIKKGLWGFV